MHEQQTNLLTRRQHNRKCWRTTYVIPSAPSEKGTITHEQRTNLLTKNVGIPRNGVQKQDGHLLQNNEGTAARQKTSIDQFTLPT
jgi:hypothetical protein